MKECDIGTYKYRDKYNSIDLGKRRTIKPFLSNDLIDFMKKRKMGHIFLVRPYE